MGIRDRIESRAIAKLYQVEAMDSLLRELDSMVEDRKEEKLPCAEPLEVIAKILHKLVNT